MVSQPDHFHQEGPPPDESGLVTYNSPRELLHWQTHSRTIVLCNLPKYFKYWIACSSVTWGSSLLLHQLVSKLSKGSNGVSLRFWNSAALLAALPSSETRQLYLLARSFDHWLEAPSLLDRFSAALRTRAGRRVCRRRGSARGVHFPMFTYCTCAQPSPFTFQLQSGRSSCISSIYYYRDNRNIDAIAQHYLLPMSTVKRISAKCIWLVKCHAFTSSFSLDYKQMKFI